METNNHQINDYSAVLERKYGRKGTSERARFDEEAYTFYTSQVLVEARKEAKMTQSELAEKVELLCREHADMGDMLWLDSGVVCRVLDISPRTLQTLRENGTMPFSRICNKVYYKPEDVRRILPVVDIRRGIAARRGKEI